MKKIAFFLLSPKFAGQWSVDDETVPLSGTDGTMLFVVRTLRESGRFQSILIGQSAPVESDFEFHRGNSLPEAYEAAKNAGAEYLVFNGASIQELEAMRALPGDGPQLVLWTQNSPGFERVCVISKLPQRFSIMAVSDYQRYGFCSYALYPRTVSIPNPAPERSTWRTPQENPVSGRQQICYIGALKESKGFHHLAEIWPSFRAKQPEIDLIVCGSSSLYDPSAGCGEAGLTDDVYERKILGCLGGSLESAQELGVFFQGSVAKAKLREIVKKSLFVVVNPNLQGSTETFCCSAIEALSLGVPVLTANAGALRDTVGHELGGLLFNNKEQFLEYMLRLTNDDVLRRKLAVQGFQHATTSYDPEKIAERWLSFFDGKLTSPFAGDIRRWVTLADHARNLQRLLPLGVGKQLRRLKARLG